LNKLELAVLMGKGKMISGKPSFNDETKKFIMTVPKIMVWNFFKSIVSFEITNFVILTNN